MRRETQISLSAANIGPSSKDGFQLQGTKPCPFSTFRARRPTLRSLSTTAIAIRLGLIVLRFRKEGRSMSILIGSPTQSQFRARLITRALSNRMYQS
jgi:hypothetical protein